MQILCCLASFCFNIVCIGKKNSSAMLGKSRISNCLDSIKIWESKIISKMTMSYWLHIFPPKLFDFPTNRYLSLKSGWFPLMVCFSFPTWCKLLLLPRILLPLLCPELYNHPSKCRPKASARTSDTTCFSPPNTLFTGGANSTMNTEWASQSQPAQAPVMTLWVLAVWPPHL